VNDDLDFFLVVSASEITGDFVPGVERQTRREREYRKKSGGDLAGPAAEQ
jgi:hypothetical protein